MKSLEISIDYKTLYFDDMIYAFNSLKEMTRNFLLKDEYWEDGTVYKYLTRTHPNLNEMDYFKSISIIRTIFRKGTTFEIIEFKEGSIKIRCSFRIAECTLIPFISYQNLIAGMTIGTMIGIANEIYNKHEREFDKKIEKLQKRWKSHSTKKGEEKREVTLNVRGLK